MPRQRYKVYPDSFWEPYFMTCVTADRVPLLLTEGVPDILLGSLQFLRSRGRIKLHAYAILTDHLHLVASAEDLTKEMQCFKSYTARSVIDRAKTIEDKETLHRLRISKEPARVGQTFQLWKQGFHPKWIISGAMCRQKIDYTNLNPVRHGIVDDPMDFPYCSYRSYYGEDPPIDVDMLQI